MESSDIDLAAPLTEHTHAFHAFEIPQPRRPVVARTARHGKVARHAHVPDPVRVSDERRLIAQRNTSVVSILALARSRQRVKLHRLVV